MGEAGTRLKVVALVAMLGGTGFVSGCGQKGPLYLPTQEELEEFQQRKEDAEQKLENRKDGKEQ